MVNNLEDILKAVEKNNKISNVEQSLASSEGSTDPETYDDFASYLQKYRGYSEADARTLAEDGMDVKKARRDARMFRSEAQSELVEIAKNNYATLIGSLSKELLEQFAIYGLKTKDKKYIDVQSKMVSGDNEGLKQLLVGKYKDDVYWQNFLAKAPEHLLKRFGSNYVKEESQKFVEKNLCDKTVVKENGKDKSQYTVNPDKVKVYIGNTINTLEPQYKSSAYLALANYVYQEDAAKKAKKK